MTLKLSVIALARRTRGGFTLAELLVSVFVLVLLIFMFTQLMTSATAITRNDHKHVDTDTQARAVLDRMALDFAQMLKRTDVDYYVKQPSGYKGHGNGHGWGQGKNGDKGSDQMAFFSHVPGYYPGSYPSPISLVAYRVNESTSTDAAYGRLERLAKGLLWNGVDNTTQNNSAYPIVFSPGQLTGCNGGNPCDTWASAWSAAINNDNGIGKGGQKIGDLEAGWNTIVQFIAQNGQTPSGKLIPREAAKGIRVYNRYFDFKTVR